MRDIGEQADTWRSLRVIESSGYHLASAPIGPCVGRKTPRNLISLRFAQSIARTVDDDAGENKENKKDGSLGVRGELLARSIEIGRGTATTHTVGGSFNSKPVRFGLNTFRAERFSG